MASASLGTAREYLGKCGIPRELWIEMAKDRTEPRKRYPSAQFRSVFVFSETEPFKNKLLKSA